MILAGRPYRDRAASLLDQVGMAPRRRALPFELSGGEAARVGLAVALALAPSVIFADEPTAEVDAATEKELVPSAQRSLRGRRDRRRRDPQRGAGSDSPRGSFAFRMDGSSMTPPIVKADGLCAPFWDRRRRSRRARTERPFPLDTVSVLRCLGPSGSGKSTLLNLIAGLDDRTGGTISWPGIGSRQALASARRRHDPSIRRP